ncbi:uracil-DNA glycosylase [Roseicyclus sp. F158]|uniref:Uracil-DNA glycosylase n=1 Tax=Tropicimonas omnivorans TaxID=3075590 RepID=A0ABU3DG93_9RHOB|nr:uracil-DNA glycosylase [Roseicyclus sp. F158]MDT0682726.1 uracil-DNA glycosylase [Roseicyclus sp. F158]
MDRLDTSRLGGWADLPFFKETLPGIEARLSAEAGPVFPPRASIFRALELTPPERTRAVILGQDPYHTRGKADGLAFSIPPGFGGRLDSLGNILKLVEAETGRRRTRTDLTDWAEQGVLLLNTALTVPEGKAQGHARLGWSRLVSEVLGRLDTAPRAFLLWGGPAQKIGARLKGPDHLMLPAPHPSPLSAYKGFFDARPLSLTNEWLARRGEAPIDWAGPDAPADVERA